MRCVEARISLHGVAAFHGLLFGLIIDQPLRNGNGEQTVHNISCLPGLTENEKLPSLNISIEEKEDNKSKYLTNGRR